ncbi:MAG: efflux RND transporter permease subunit [Prevotella sp.]|nr:efflux RND transporter permease subunit [Prevotella sp.]MCM1074382.1 efflux RND transporter permease subunit [Ruminococcus sp.]
MFSKFFIMRPIFATVLAVLMVLAGLLCVTTLPVAQYPDITPPTVMVSASYPGADAETVAKTVGVPIEQQVNGTEGMLYMSSNSGSDGSYSLTITFENGTDVDQAAVDVQNRISMATATLPSEVQQQGISVSKESSNQVLFCALETDRPDLYDALYLTNYAQINIIDPLSRVEGVGGASAFGGGEYSMRIWLDPLKMRSRNLTPEEVLAAVRGQNMQVGAGTLGAEPQAGNTQFQFTLTSQGRLTTAEEFGNIIIRSDDTGILRLKDVGTVELGSESYSQTAKVNGKTAAVIGVQQLPGANALDVVNGSLKELDRLSQYFPEGVHYRVILNTTDFVKASIDEVVVTFVETTLIVMLVILIFLQNWRAVIIPMLTIPVSLIATFAVMKLLGFSLNTLSLFGMVLAIAIVVDDAIVVVEDCSRLLDEGKLNRKEAAVKAMQELTGPVVGEVLVLLSVFIPTAFISGITGKLYKQFALTIAVSTAFSGFNALTLTPALCALFLKPSKQNKFFLYRWFDVGWAKVESLYKKVISKMLAKPVISLCVFLLIAGAAIYGFLKLPTGYLPEEDNGYFMMAVQLPTGASLERTEKYTDAIIEEVMKEVPEVKDVMNVNGMSFLGGGASSNGGTLFFVLKPWKERKGKSQDVESVMERVQAIAARHPEAIAFCVNPPSIPGLGMSSGLQMQLLDINNLGPVEMKKAIEALQEAAAKDDRIAQLTSLYEGTVPQYSVKIDRDKVSLLGLDLSTIYSTLSTYVGGSYANDFNEFGRTFQVTVSGDGNSRDNPEDILKLSVQNSEGEMTPFSAFASIEPSMGEPAVSRYNMYGTASVTATLAHGVSSSDGIKAMEQLVKDNLGENYSFAWTGEAYQETQSGTTISFVFIFAIVMTILVLAAQYESWTDPIAVVLSMPMAILGTVVGCLVMNQSVSIYTQIGVILLLGMSAKNAILIVEYAMDYRKQGLPIRQAALDGGVVRFRPIMMTALAFVFGVMPMMFATGAGAASRIEIGTAVVFGMAMNAFIGTLFVPNFWELMQRIQEKYLNGLFKLKKPAGALPGNPDSSGKSDPSDSI